MHSTLSIIANIRSPGQVIAISSTSQTTNQLILFAFTASFSYNLFCVRSNETWKKMIEFSNSLIFIHYFVNIILKVQIRITLIDCSLIQITFSHKLRFFCLVTFPFKSLIVYGNTEYSLITAESNSSLQIVGCKK